MKTRISFFHPVCLLVLALTLSTARAASFVTIDDAGKGRYDVKFGGKLFTSLHTEGFAKPILYPIIGPHDIRMTRDYPMKKDTPGEASDHPHHQSLWYTHGSVNGVSFWELSKGAGQIVTTGVKKVSNGGSEASIEFSDKWVDVAGKVVCTDDQKITFHAYKNRGGAESAYIDYEVTIHASEGDVVFGDTKEGSMGVRTHTALQISSGAKAVNSEGVEGKEMWGKRARWVDYSAEIAGNRVGIAILDHPKNPRYPTWWHARDYGLVAANPFGIHDFEKKPAGTGDLKVAKGESITFRYRFVFHEGDAVKAGIEALHGEFK